MDKPINSPNSALETRHDWTNKDAEELFALPFNDLIFFAQTVHRRYFNANAVQLSNLLSIKTGSCPEDCAYCPQSAHHNADLESESLMNVAARKNKGQLDFVWGLHGEIQKIPICRPFARW